MCLKAITDDMHTILHRAKHRVKLLPGSVRLQLVTLVRNRRLLYSDNLSMLTDGCQPVELDLGHACNLSGGDLQHLSENADLSLLVKFKIDK
jgi:hypothetical protein